jgi:GNAT superfamily N-acetyltransferase
MLTFRRANPAEEPAHALLEALRATLTELNDGVHPDSDTMPSAGAADFDVILVGFLDGVPTCCGGLKPLGGGAVEIKRMYVDPSARGQGVGRAMLARLEDEARERAYTVARLDTGARQPHAQRMYRHAGYVEIDNFNANPIATFFGEKLL